MSGLNLQVPAVTAKPISEHSAGFATELDIGTSVRRKWGMGVPWAEAKPVTVAAVRGLDILLLVIFVANRTHGPSLGSNTS